MPGEEAGVALGSFGEFSFSGKVPALTLGLWGISPALTLGLWVGISPALTLGLSSGRAGAADGGSGFAPALTLGL